MTSQDLTRQQAEQLRDAVRQQLRYLTLLVERTDRRGFPGDDPLRRAAMNAQAATQALFMELHYLSCGSGVGRSPRG